MKRLFKPSYFIGCLLAVTSFSADLKADSYCNFNCYWPFPTTWSCPKCGYDNYDGINHCALCGTPRPSRNR